MALRPSRRVVRVLRVTAAGSTLYGQKGDDTLSGGTGRDRLWGGKGDDVLMGGANNWDYLEGGFGADVIDGGDGFDFAGYELSDAGVTIDLATGAAEGGHAEGDTLTGIEGVFWSNYADHLSGDAGSNLLNSGDGDDTLAGGAGDSAGNTPLHLASAWVSEYYEPDREWTYIGDPHAGVAIAALLAAGANPGLRNADGLTPWDLADQNEALKGSDIYWRLNDAQFNAPLQESRRPTAPDLAGQQAAASERLARQGPACEIPGYPTPADVQSIGLSWCGSTVGFQRRAFALQAAGAWCAIDGGTSSSPDQISARHQEINAACDALDAFAVQGGPPCQCPDGYRP